MHFFFFLLQSLNVRASENLSDSSAFSIGSIIKRPKLHVFSRVFLFNIPDSLRLECSIVRKIPSFLALHRPKKHESLHPRSFTNRAKTW